MELATTGTLDSKPFYATHLILTRQRTKPEILLKMGSYRWSIECWQWIRDTQLHKDPDRYQANSAGTMATLRTAGLNLLRLAGFQSIRNGMQAVMQNIMALLALVMRRQHPNHC